MNRDTVHAEGVKCVKKVQTYNDGLQICPGICTSCITSDEFS